MKILKFSMGLLIFSIDVILVVSFPFDYVFGSINKLYLLLACLGGVVYLGVHIVRKPEKFYVWNHEVSHLLTSKIFMRDVTGFHITNKMGGKIVVDKTNFVIDLAPYVVFPLIIIFVFLAILMRKAGFDQATLVYFLLAGYILGMMFAFTAESFLAGQEDIRRNGLVFSISVILLGNIIILPLYLLPGVGGKKIFIKNFFLLWGGNLSHFLFHIKEFAVTMFGVADRLLKH